MTPEPHHMFRARTKGQDAHRIVHWHHTQRGLFCNLDHRRHVVTQPVAATCVVTCVWCITGIDGHVRL